MKEKVLPGGGRTTGRRRKRGPSRRTSRAQQRDLEWSRGSGLEQCDGRVPSGTQGAEAAAAAAAVEEVVRVGRKRIIQGPPVRSALEPTPFLW